jgi:bacillithiol synthase
LRLAAFADNGAVVPFEQMPGMPPLFLRYVRGGAGEFLPGKPALDAVAARARELSGSGRNVRIAAGQQAGLFTGPLFSLTKAAAALRVAHRLAGDGIPATGLFWIATEDHDLEEISQVTLLQENGPKTYRLVESADKNFQPAGTVAVPASIERVFGALRGDPDSQNAAILELFERFWSPGKTFGRAFRETMEHLVPGGEIEWIDPLEPRWRAGKLEFFRRALESAPDIVSALDLVDARLREAGYTPQVSRSEHDFPCFLIENGLRRKISFDAGSFLVHGNPRPFAASELADYAEKGGHEPSPAALLRPVLQSWLFPVAAQILGPAELAYHAQSGPLFSIFGLAVPILLPRPHLLPRGARERRTQEALEIPDSQIFHAREAARRDAPPVAVRLREFESRFSAELAAVGPEIGSIDPTLSPVLTGAVKKISHQIERLREKVEKAAERKDEEKNRRLESIERALAPGGVPADRVYTPLTYLLRFGEAFVPKVLAAAECRLDGAHFVDFA